MGSVDSSHHCIMKVLVIFGVIAAALAAPLPEAESDAGVVVAHHAAVAPLGYALPAAHAAVAPVATAAVATHAAVAPVAYAAPAPAVVQTHSVATPVALPPKEVKVPITTHHYEIPVHQKVHC